MKHLSAMLSWIETPAAEAAGEATRVLAAPAHSDTFLINPYLGLIGLGVLIVTGAVAVIREIQIEEDEQNN